jgi:hypothetical protein
MKPWGLARPCVDYVGALLLSNTLLLLPHTQSEHDILQVEKEEADSYRTRVLDLEAERAVLQEQIEAAKQATQAKLKAAKEDYDKEIAGLRSQLAKARASSSRTASMSAAEAGTHISR